MYQEFIIQTLTEDENQLKKTKGPKKKKPKKKVEKIEEPQPKQEEETKEVIKKKKASSNSKKKQPKKETTDKSPLLASTPIEHDQKDTNSLKLGSFSLEPKARLNEFQSQNFSLSDVQSNLKGDKTAGRDSSFEVSPRDEEEISEFVRKITIHMVDLVCEMMNEDTTSQGIQSSHIMSERKQANKDFYHLGADTSASSKIDSHFTATEASEADDFSLSNATRRKKKGNERKQSFGAKKKFKEEIELHPRMTSVNDEVKSRGSALSSGANQINAPALRKHESVHDQKELPSKT